MRTTKKPCIRCGVMTLDRFWVHPDAEDAGPSVPCCEVCCTFACDHSVTDRGLRFSRGIAWLRAEGKARKGKEKG